MDVSSLASVLIFACTSCGSPTPAPSVSPVPVRTVSTSAAAPPSACQAVPPALASYDAITAGQPFSLQLERGTDTTWQPREQLKMPLHHASQLAWVDTTALDAQRDDVVTVVAMGLGRTSLEHDPDRNTWFASYAARIEHVCPATR
jgi:hypothetical protein